MKQIYIFILGILISPSSFAGVGSLVKVNKSKKIALVKGGGFKANEEVCFYNGPTKLHCGKVVKTKDQASIVRVTSLEGLSKNTLVKNVSTEPEPVSNHFLIRGYWSPVLGGFSPSRYNTLCFDDSESTAIGVPLSACQPIGYYPWSTDGTSAQSGLGPLGLGVEIGLQELGLSLGLRYQSYPTASSYGNYYGSVFEGIFAMQTETQGESFGIYLDYYYHTIFDSLKLGVGVDVDVSTVYVSSIRKYAPIEGLHTEDVQDSVATLQQDEVLYIGNSQTITFSLRFPMTYDLAVTPSLSTYLNVTPGIPLTYVSSFSGGHADPYLETTAGVADPIKDMGSALSHMNSAFFLFITFGATLAL